MSTKSTEVGRVSLDYLTFDANRWKWVARSMLSMYSRLSMLSMLSMSSSEVLSENIIIYKHAYTEAISFIQQNA